MARNVVKSPFIRFVYELDHKEILISVKRTKKVKCPSGLVLVQDCELKRVTHRKIT